MFPARRYFYHYASVTSLYSTDSICLPRSDCPEPLLARGVPDLQFDGLAVQLDGADLEIDPDGGNVRLGVCVVGETEQEAGFAHAGVSDQEQLEQVVAAKRREILNWSPTTIHFYRAAGP